MRVLVTRPLDDAERTAQALQDAGHEPLIAPIFAIRPLPHEIPPGFDALVATSANALRMANLGGIAMATPLATVGDATAEDARSLGFQSVLSAGGDSRALAELLVKHFPQGTRLGWLAGLNRQDEALRTLNSHFSITTIETYENAAVDVLPDDVAAAMRAGTIDAVLHFSKRSAEVFATLVRTAGLESEAQKLLHVFISEAAASIAYPNQRIAARPDMAAMIAALATA